MKFVTPRLDRHVGGQVGKNEYGDYYNPDYDLATCFGCIRDHWCLPDGLPEHIWLTVSDKPLREAHSVYFEMDFADLQLKYTFDSEYFCIMYSWFEYWLLKNFPQLQKKGTHRLYVQLSYEC